MHQQRSPAIVIAQQFDVHGVRGRTKVVRALHCDTALRAVFGSGLEATEETVRTGLESYVTDLRNDTDDLLVVA